MFCPNCGNQIDDGASFCTYCGSRLASAEAPAPAPQPEVFQQTFSSPDPQPAYQPTYTPPVYPAAPPARVRVAGVVVLSAIGLAALLFSLIVRLDFYGTARYLITLSGIPEVLEILCIIVFLFALIKIKPNLAFIPPSVFTIGIIIQTVNMISYGTFGYVWSNYLTPALALFMILATIFFASAINPGNAHYHGARVCATIFGIIALLIELFFMVMDLIQAITIRYGFLAAFAIEAFGHVLLIIALLVGTYKLRKQ